MDWSSGLAWWSALRSRRAARSQAADRADMGTAFGLDASFGPADEDARAPGPSPARSTPQPTARHAWEHRLVRRTGL